MTLVLKYNAYVVISGGEIEFEDSANGRDLGEGSCLDTVGEGEERTVGVTQSTGVQSRFEVDSGGNKVDYDLGRAEGQSTER